MVRRDQSCWNSFFNFEKYLFYFYLCIHWSCHRDQKSMSDSLRLESQTVVSAGNGTGPLEEQVFFTLSHLSSSKGNIFLSRRSTMLVCLLSKEMIVYRICICCIGVL